MPRQLTPHPTGEQMDAILRGLGASTIVVGHTKVDRPQFVYEKRRVLALDVPWTKPKDVRGLWIEDGKSSLVDIRGRKEELVEPASAESR